MRPAIRSQADSLEVSESYSAAAAIFFPELEDRTRQEFAADADVNRLLRRYGVGVPLAPVRYGDQDFDMDLQQGLNSVDEANRAFLALPEALRAKYPNWPRLLEALTNGQLKLADDGAIVESAGDGQPPSAAPAGSES